MVWPKKEIEADKKVECCKAEAGHGISKWRPDHKEPCSFAFLTRVSSLRVQQGYACVCVCVCACACARAQSYPILFNTMNCSPPGSSVRGIIQARILEWVLPFPPAGDLPDPRIEPMSLVPPTLAGKFLTTAPPGKPNMGLVRTNLLLFDRLLDCQVRGKLCLRYLVGKNCG